MYLGALGVRGGTFGSTGTFGKYTGKSYDTFMVASRSNWESTCREWKEECQRGDRNYFRAVAPMQVEAYLKYKEKVPLYY